MILPLFFLSMASALAQSVQVKGKVTDENGIELPGVTVLLKGTTTATPTGADGTYSLDVPDGSGTLVFSYIGYQPQEVPINNQSTVNVNLLDDAKSLQEVVVVGYGTQKRENLTGAVSTVSSEAIQNRPVANVATALQGVAPGLNITRTTGQPGNEGIGIQIRGATSANGNVDPLIVVDGVASPGVTLQTMNPNDIATISVLKDAAAASIYGAQAAGGVILITTKQGKDGKVVFDYSTQVGVDWALNLPQRMETWEEAEYSNLARANAGQGPEYTAEEIGYFKDGSTPYIINPADTNNYLYYNTESIIDQVVRKNTAMQTHNLSARGGTEKLNFMASVGFYDKQGMFKVGPDKNERYNARLNLGAQLTKHLSLDSRISYTLQQIETSSNNISGNGGTLLHSLYRNSRNRYPTFTPEGRYNYQGAQTYAQLESGGYNNYTRNFFDGVFTLRLAEVVKGLQLRAVYGVQYRLGDREIFDRTVEMFNRTGVASRLNNPNFYQLRKELDHNNNLQFLADYDLSIGAKHNFHILGGYQYEDIRGEDVETRTTNLVSNDLPSLVLGDDRTKTNNQSISTYAFQSLFGRFNYNYDGKYLLEATLRVDESSRLAPGLRVKVFPSASAGWNLHRESWFSETLPLFYEFKLRGSWGTLGNAQGIGNYDYLALLNRGNNLVLGTPESRSTYFYQNTVPASRLSWETIETMNGGLDMGFFNNRLQASVDYYVKYNRNMLTPMQLPATFGVGTPKANNGELKSWGWETELRYQNTIGNSFNYSVAVNVSDNQNELMQYAGRRVIPRGVASILEGYPLNTIWGYQTAGYFTSEAEVDEWAFQDSRAGVGDVKYVDLDGDNKITVGKGTPEDHGDLVFLGTTQPRYLFGFNLAMDWKGLDFAVFAQGVGKRNFMPSSDVLEPLPYTWQQAMDIHRDYWTPENPDALYPRPYLGGRHNFLVSDKWVLDASYMRIKNLQVGYTLPEAWTQKARIARARIFFTGQDLLTISGLGKFQDYLDPEQANNTGSAYPFFGTAAMGLNLTF
ncbi:SusC/RagA family TonB-linked outer membrane protein [Pontibacter diazotrophicus]|nr:TonB-dependent receptor [Pontibacter diazotrophicus]